LLGLIGSAVGCRKDSPPITQSPLSNYTGGGTASKFGRCGNIIFTISGANLGVYDVSNSSNPLLLGKAKLNVNPLSLYGKGDTLFVTHNAGINLYNVSNPLAPVLLNAMYIGGALTQIVAGKDYAFVSMHTVDKYDQYGTLVANEGLNQVWALDISNLSKMTVANKYHLGYPIGISLSNNYLYVCDSGMKVLDLSTMPYITLKTKFKLKSNPDHVISYGNSNILLSAPDGIYQYHYDQDTTLSLLSKIK